MKFLFSIIFFFSSIAQASLVSIQYVGDNKELVEEVIKIFQVSYELPVELISSKQTESCSKGIDQLSTGIHLCIDNQSQLLFTGANNLELTRKSILSFSENLGDNYVN